MDKFKDMEHPTLVSGHGPILETAKRIVERTVF